MSDIAVIDLFCGAGGLGLGAERAGCRHALSIDADRDSCATLRANNPDWGESVFQADVTGLTGIDLLNQAGLSKRDPLLIVGGPPCQPFSKGAYWATGTGRKASSGEEPKIRPSRAEDPRKDLVPEFMRLVSEAKADGFVFENVRSILHPRSRPVLEYFLNTASKNGYKTILVKANAADFGVPQSRERVFVIGSRRREPKEPQPTHAEKPRAKALGLRKYRNAGRALWRYGSSRYSEEGEDRIGKWADHLKEIPPGGNYKHLTAWAGHPSPTFVTETRYWNFLLKLHKRQPSWTITASIGAATGPFHWDNRHLRTPELAALQGFSHGYEFVGGRRSRIRQIGNAVPPPLAEAMSAAALASIVK